MRHLTTVYKDKEKSEIKAYALAISVPVGERAQVVSDALVAKLGDETSYKKSEFVCNCIISGVMEPVHQSRVERALTILDQNEHSLDVIDWGNDEGSKRLAKKMILDARMALTGCPVKNSTTFTGELSQEYIKRYGDE